MITKRKAFAYITRGNDLLLFRHLDFPEAGLQVPAGTIEEGETPPIAALREAAKETGLDELTLVEYLATRRGICRTTVKRKFINVTSTIYILKERLQHVGNISKVILAMVVTIQLDSNYFGFACHMVCHP